MEIPTELALELMLAADFLNGTNVWTVAWLIYADSMQSDLFVFKLETFRITDMFDQNFGA